MLLRQDSTLDLRTERKINSAVRRMRFCGNRRIRADSAVRSPQRVRSYVCLPRYLEEDIIKESQLKFLQHVPLFTNNFSVKFLEKICVKINHVVQGAE